MNYDSTNDTMQHIATVQRFGLEVVINLAHRLHVHDASKLTAPEKPIFDEFTPKLSGITYGSDEYKAYLAAMGEALQHHYAANTHHPEHYAAGIDGMSLLDLIEMLADWKAATMRHADGDLAKSIEINQARFGINDQLRRVFENTVRELRWIDGMEVD